MTTPHETFRDTPGEAQVIDGRYERGADHSHKHKGGNLMKYEFHEAADLFPLLPEKELAELAANIKERGQIVPVVLLDDKILDGRNRYLACVQIGIEPKVIQFDGGDPWEFVWSLNAERRHLQSNEQKVIIWNIKNERSTAWQKRKAAIQKERAEKSGAARQGKPQRTTYVDQSDPDMFVDQPKPEPKVESQPQQTHVAREEKARITKTSPAAVARGDMIYNKRPDLAHQVASGEMKASEALRQIKRDEVSQTLADLPQDKYRVIYADPPWHYGNSGAIDEGDHYSRVSKHYPSMTIAELCAMDVKSIALDDAVLFMWVTSPLLAECFDVIRAWGFKYKSSFVWDKVKHNFGHYNSVRHEFLLICTRGACTPDSDKKLDSVVSIEKTGHSEKPNEFRAIIDELYPNGKRIELFLRGEPAPGWDGYGNEAELSA